MHKNHFLQNICSDKKKLRHNLLSFSSPFTKSKEAHQWLWAVFQNREVFWTNNKHWTLPITVYAGFETLNSMQDTILICGWSPVAQSWASLSLELWDSVRQSKETFITAAGETRPSSVKIELNQILWVYIVQLISCRFIVLYSSVFYLYRL